jgi:hypothetical protein
MSRRMVLRSIYNFSALRCVAQHGGIEREAPPVRNRAVRNAAHLVEHKVDVDPERSCRAVARAVHAREKALHIGVEFSPSRDVLKLLQHGFAPRVRPLKRARRQRERRQCSHIGQQRRVELCVAHSAAETAALTLALRQRWVFSLRSGSLRPACLGRVGGRDPCFCHSPRCASGGASCARGHVVRSLCFNAVTGAFTSLFHGYRKRT